MKFNKYLKNYLFNFTITLCFPLLVNAQQQCINVFAKKNPSVSSVKYLVGQGLDFVSTDFVGPASQLRSNGCAAVCAANVFETIRLYSGLQPKSKSELVDLIYQQTKSQLAYSGFGYHAAVTASTGLNVGSLARLLDRLFKANAPQVAYSLQSIFINTRRNDFADEGNIKFLQDITKDALNVNETRHKIIQVSVNDKNRLALGNSYLTGHFYTVLSYKDGIVTLHDPNIKGSQIQFKAIRDTDSATGLTSFILEPITPNYTIDRNFPRDLLYVVSGYVALDIH